MQVPQRAVSHHVVRRGVVPHQHHASRSTQLLLVVLVLVILGSVAACGGGTGAGTSSTTLQRDSTTTSTAQPRVERFTEDQDGFYQPPDPLPAGNHGDLLRVQPIAGAPDGVTWQRLMYLSKSVSGRHIAVTAVLTLPAAEPPEGGWPLIAHAHGTTGIADVCAPSLSLSSGGPHAGEIRLLSSSVARDRFALVSTDYEGLGVPGRHPYLVGVSAGRSVLDAVLAARQLEGIDRSGAVGIIGYSQGGHAAAWANQLAPKWAPGLDISGVLAGAPASEVPQWVALDASATRPLLQARQVMVAAGLAATDERFSLDEALSPAGHTVLEQLDQDCEPALPAGEPLTRVDLTTTEPWAAALAGNVPGSARGAAPVLIVHSRTDIVIPLEQGEEFAARLCHSGQIVELRILPEGEHVPTAVPAYQQGLEWLQGLRTGAPPRSTCP